MKYKITFIAKRNFKSNKTKYKKDIKYVKNISFNQLKKAICIIETPRYKILDMTIK